jgi:hypothetical protein
MRIIFSFETTVMQPTKTPPFKKNAERTSNAEARTCRCAEPKKLAPAARRSQSSAASSAKHGAALSESEGEDAERDGGEGEYGDDDCNGHEEGASQCEEQEFLMNHTRQSCNTRQSFNQHNLTTFCP